MAGALVLALLGPSPASAEPNDTMATAQGPMTGSFIGAIDTENDVDWYFVYARDSTQLDVALAGLGPEESCQNWNVMLRDSDGHELSSTRANFNEVDHIRYTLSKAGKYYLEVSGFFCEAPGSYRIDLAASPPLLTSPPPVPMAPSPESPQACRQAERRVRNLRQRLQHATSRQQRHRLTSALRHARSAAARLC